MTSMLGSGARMATSRPAYVVRFDAAERTLHWLLAITFLLMMASGLVLYLPSLATLAADRVLWKTIHLSSAVVFWAGLVALIPGNSHRLRTTAREIDRFDEDDGRWLRWAVARSGAEPPQGRFNAGQKLNTAIVAGLMVVFTAQRDADVPPGARRQLPRHQRDPRPRLGDLDRGPAGARATSTWRCCTQRPATHSGASLSGRCAATGPAATTPNGTPMNKWCQAPFIHSVA